MDGLIVKKQFAMKLVRGFKKKEFRKTSLPKNKINTQVLILTPQKDGGIAVGTVIFTGQKKISEQNYEWFVGHSIEYDRIWKYVKKFGCQIWMKNVEFDNEIKL